MKTKPKTTGMDATDLLLLVTGIQSNKSVAVPMEVELPVEHWLKLLRSAPFGDGSGMPHAVLKTLVQAAVRKYLFPNEDVETPTPQK